VPPKVTRPDFPQPLEAQPWAQRFSVQSPARAGPSAAGTQAVPSPGTRYDQRQDTGPFDLAGAPSPAPNSSARRRAPQQAVRTSSVAATQDMPPAIGAAASRFRPMPTAPEAPEGPLATQSKVEERGTADLQGPPAKASPPGCTSPETTGTVQAPHRHPKECRAGAAIPQHGPLQRDGCGGTQANADGRNP